MKCSVNVLIVEDMKMIMFTLEAYHSSLEGPKESLESDYEVWRLCVINLISNLLALLIYSAWFLLVTWSLVIEDSDFKSHGDVTKYTQTPHWWADGRLKAEKYLHTLCIMHCPGYFWCKQQPINKTEVLGSSDWEV